MSRSAADATRFTATGPYVSSKAPYQLPDSLKQNKQSTPSTSQPTSKATSSISSSSQNQSSPPGETPRQKVERLRAQARAARLAQSGNAFDRIIERGRRVANSAHKVMIYTLITASGTPPPFPFPPPFLQDEMLTVSWWKRRLRRPNTLFRRIPNNVEPPPTRTLARQTTPRPSGGARSICVWHRNTRSTRDSA